MTLELGVLVSGRGSNLQAVLDAIAAQRLDARVRLVLSNKPGAFALERARSAGIPTHAITHGSHASREAFDQALVEALKASGAEWILLAGFMRVLTPVFLRAFPGRIINIHPALLPAFPGIHSQKQAVDYGVKISGCTVHLVDEGVDSGPIIGQRAVPVLDDDSEDSLGARILIEEHRLLVEVLNAVSEGRIQVEPGGEGRRPRVLWRR